MRTFIAVIALTLLFTSCSKKDSIDYKITASQNDINYDETSQLKISAGSVTEYTWESSDEFVGIVDANAMFTAKHIGETTITAKKDGKSVSSIKMTVLPTETFFEEPVLEFGQTISYIKSKEKRSLEAETTEGLGYSETSSLINGVYYFFDANGLKSSLVDFADNTTAINRSKVFYDERYTYEGFFDGTALYTSKDEKILIGLNINDSWGYGALCIRNTSGTSAKASLKQLKQALSAKSQLLLPK